MHSRDREEIRRDPSINRSYSAGEKDFRRILDDVGRYHLRVLVSARYHCGHLPDEVWPLIEKRDQRRLDNPLDHALQLLERDIRQEAQPTQIATGPFCAGWGQEVESTPEDFNRHRQKNPYHLEGDC